MKPTDTTPSEESAIQGLMLLGRTRDQALKEIRANEEDQMRQAEREWWDRSRSPEGHPALFS